MAKINIKLNNTNFEIDEAVVAEAIAALKSHLSTTMSGSGATINLGGVAYNIDSTKLSTATNTFISHLGTIAGEGAKIKIGNIEYSVDASKISSSMSELGTAFGELENGGSGDDEPVALAAGLYDEDGSMLASWDELTTTYGMDCTKNYDALTYKTSTASPYYVLINNEVIANGKILVIGDITTIGKYAFADCTSLTSVTIPNSVISIGESAFVNCGSLTSITIPNSVTSIGNSAFCNCSSLTSVEIPDSVTSIRYCAFEGCTSLTSVEIPDSVTSIEYNAFKGCISLTSIVIPDSVTSIGNSTFSGCTSLTSVEIPDSVTKIDGSAFYGCSSLTSVEIPDSVTSIEYNAFKGCISLTSIVIPDSVTSIGDSAFNGCTSLTSIEIPDSVTSIGEYAFSHCTSLTSIEIPDSVTSLGNYAFYDCTALTGIVIPNSVKSIEMGAFRGCTSLASVEMSDLLISIGAQAFYLCKSLTSIEIPDSVTSIGHSAFTGCALLTVITFKGTVEQWNSIALGSNWSSHTLGVKCNNGGVHFKDCSYTNEITKEPTCTEAGIRTYTCSICGDSYTEEIPALGHNYIGEITKEPTCTETGIRAYTCPVCGDVSRTEEIPALGHSYTNEITKEPTCTEAGIRTYTCSICGDSYTEEIPALGHNYIGEITKEPTCTPGIMTYTCSVCGDSCIKEVTSWEFNDEIEVEYDFNYVLDFEVDGRKGTRIYQTYSGPGVSVLAFEFEDGSYSTVYNTSSYWNYSYGWQNDAYKTILVTEELTDASLLSWLKNNTKEKHLYQSEITTSPTCDLSGIMTYTCSVCGDSYTEEIPALGHEYVSEVTKEATSCADPGVRTFTCSRCGDSYTKPIVIPHSYVGGVCTGCGAEVPLSIGTWVLNDELVFDPNVNFEFPFTFEGSDGTTECTTLYVGYAYSDQGGHIKYGTNIQEPWGSTRSFAAYCFDSVWSGTPGWQDDCYKTITITQNITDDAAREWLLTNATALHSYKVESVVQPTCTAPGLTTYVCTDCGDVLTETTTVPHTYVNDICTGCGKEKPAGGVGVWLLNDELDFTLLTPDEHYAADILLSNGNEKKSIKYAEVYDGIYGLSYCGYADSAGPNDLRVYMTDELWGSPKGWSNKSYKTITVKTEITNATLLEWLNVNGTYVSDYIPEEPEIEEDIVGTWLLNKTGVASLDPNNYGSTNNFNINGTMFSFDENNELVSCEFVRMSFAPAWSSNPLSIYSSDPSEGGIYSKNTYANNMDSSEGVCYNSDTGENLSYNSYYDFSDDQKTSFRTITITGGDDVENEGLIAWINANATKVA